MRFLPAGDDFKFFAKDKNIFAIFMNMLLHSCAAAASVTLDDDFVKGVRRL